MIKTSLNYGEEAETSQLSMAMFYMVKPGKMNVPTLGLKTMLPNIGLNGRYHFTKESHIVDMMGPIHSDIFFKDQVLLISVIFSIKLNQGKNSFCLISSAAPPSFKVVIKEAILFIRRVKLASSIILDHAAAPKYSSATYHIHRIDCKVLSVPWGFSSLTLTTLGRIPK